MQLAKQDFSGDMLRQSLNIVVGGESNDRAHNWVSSPKSLGVSLLQVHRAGTPGSYCRTGREARLAALILELQLPAEPTAKPAAKASRG